MTSCPYIVPGKFQTEARPDMVIVEGLNVLPVNAGQHRDVSEHVVAKDHFDLFAHVDAAEDVSAIAGQIWSDINLVNLRENIAPIAGHAHLVLVRDREHRVCMARLRKTRAG